MPSLVVPTVSVIIPTYNRARLIGEAIQSVLDQTFTDLELIVVDDGSTDNTESVVTEFKDPRVRYIHQENMGISAARNAGIHNTQGRYVAFLDSDDLWLPQLLELQVRFLDGSPHIGVVYAKAQAMTENGRLLLYTRGDLERYPNQPLKSMLYGDFTCIQTALVHRECLDRAGLFDESLTGRVDWDMFLRLAKVCRFAFTDTVLAHFRAHSLQHTGVKSEYFAEVCESGIKVLDKAFSDPDLPKEILAIKPLAYRNAYMDMGLRWMGVPEWTESARSFWRAIRVSPNPFVTPFRIGWLIFFYKVLSKTKWGNRLISALVGLKRGRRQAPDQ